MLIDNYCGFTVLYIQGLEFAERRAVLIFFFSFRLHSSPRFSPVREEKGTKKKDRDETETVSHIQLSAPKQADRPAFCSSFPHHSTLDDEHIHRFHSK